MVNYRNALLWTGWLTACAASLHATPTLQLASTTLEQVTVNTGANGPTQSVDAQNTGSGSLNLQVSASATWLAATVGKLPYLHQRKRNVPAHQHCAEYVLARGRHVRGSGAGLRPERHRFAAVYQRERAGGQRFSGHTGFFGDAGNVRLAAPFAQEPGNNDSDHDR